MTFLYTVAFHRLALNRRGNILGGIIGIHRDKYVGIYVCILCEIPSQQK